MAVQFTFEPEKATEAMIYLASLGLPGLSKYKMCKLLVLADKHQLVRFGRTITCDRLCAMEHGPVPSASLNMLNHILSGEELTAQELSLAERVTIDRRYRFPRFAADRGSFNPDILSESDMTSLNEIAEEHGRKTVE